MSTDKPREFWIEQDDNELLSVYRFHPGNAHQLFHVIEIEAYQSLQEKYEEMNFQNENLELSEKFFQEKTNELQSRVKELSEENERLKSALTPLLETMDFIQRNHNVMNVHAHAKLSIEKFDEALKGG